MDITWPLVFLSRIVDGIAKHLSWITILMTFFTWITGLLDAVVSGGITAIMGKFSEVNLDQFGNVSFSGLEYINYINAVFPVTELLGLSGALCSLWVAVIIIRWIKSFIPTIAN